METTYEIILNLVDEAKRDVYASPDELCNGLNQSPQTATPSGPSMRNGAECLFIGTAAPHSYPEKEEG